MGSISAPRKKKVKCKWCGKGLEQKKAGSKYCGKQCREYANRQNAKTRHLKACEICKKKFRSYLKTKTCSKECHRLLVSKNQLHISKWYECKWCNKKFRKGGGRCKGWFCTVTCSGMFQRNKRAVKEFWEWAKPCKRCGGCVGRLTKEPLCEKCKQEKKLCTAGAWLFYKFMRPCQCGKPIWKHKNAGSVELCCDCIKKSTHEVSCNICGVKFTAKGRKASCGRNCRDCKARSKQARKGKHRERCKKYGLPYESVSLAFLYARDKGHCKICKCKCLKRFSTILGTKEPNPRSPTIDHVIPLGHPDNYNHGHTKENTQLCCWKCNVEKNDARNTKIGELIASAG